MTEHPDRPGYSFSPGPPPEASRFLKTKGLRPAFSWQDVEPEEHAVAFTVAKAMQIDVLTTIREEVQKALDQGLPLAQFQKTLRPRLEKLGWWGWKEMVDPETGEPRQVKLGSPRRLRTIYNANLRSARAAGQWERIERTKKLLPFLEYRLGPSERHRPHHAIKEGLVLPVDDPFWDAWMPPNGWGCKCWVKQITRREAIEVACDLTTAKFFVSVDGIVVDEYDLPSVGTGSFASSRFPALVSKSGGSAQLSALFYELSVWKDATADGSTPAYPAHKTLYGPAATVNADGWKRGINAT